GKSLFVERDQRDAELVEREPAHRRVAAGEEPFAGWNHELWLAVGAERRRLASPLPESFVVGRNAETGAPCDDDSVGVGKRAEDLRDGIRFRKTNFRTDAAAGYLSVCAQEITYRGIG